MVKMEVKSKRDQSFVFTMFVAIFSLLIMCLTFMFLLRNHLDLVDYLFLLALFLSPIPFMIWIAVDVKYVFHDDHLFLKAGFLKSRIPYEDIIGVKPTLFKVSDFFVGHRMLSARDGVVITYRSGHGEVKISPEDRELFLEELKKRVG